MPAPERRAPPGDLHSGRVLGADETILWEGRPRAVGLARRALGLPVVGAYFGLILALDLVDVIRGGGHPAAPFLTLAAGLATLAILFALAAAMARATRYVVTDRRIVMRYGLALPRSLSIPFRQIATMQLSLGRGGRGDVALGLRPDATLPLLKLWPHARPWRLGRPQPMLCDIDGAALLATRLARLLAEAEHERARRDAVPAAENAGAAARQVAAA